MFWFTGVGYALSSLLPFHYQCNCLPGKISLEMTCYVSSGIEYLTLLLTKEHGANQLSRYFRLSLGLHLWVFYFYFFSNFKLVQLSK